MLIIGIVLFFSLALLVGIFSGIAENRSQTRDETVIWDDEALEFLERAKGVWNVLKEVKCGRASISAYSSPPSYLLEAIGNKNIGRDDGGIYFHLEYEGAVDIFLQQYNRYRSDKENRESYTKLLVEFVFNISYETYKSKMNWYIENIMEDSVNVDKYEIGLNYVRIPFALPKSIRENDKLVKRFIEAIDDGRTVFGTGN